MLRIVVFTLTIGLTAGASLAVDDLYVYPTKNQSEEQIGRDKQECHDWAVKQTGVDPVKMASEPAELIRSRYADDAYDVIECTD